jgi:putative addiction module component (TIGR02574 family)
MINLQQTLAELTELPLADRLQLVTSLWDSIPTDAPIEISPDQQAELDRRIAAYDKNPDDLLTWDQVLAALRERE